MADNEVKIQITAEDMYTAVMNGVVDGMKKTQTALKEATEEAAKSVATLGEAYKGLGRAALYFNAIQTAAQSAWQTLMQASAPAMEMEKLNAQFKAASGSAELAAKDLGFVREEATRLGLSFQDTAGAFAKFAASTRNTSIEGEKAKLVFSSVAEASTALRLSSEETSGILLAFSQMLGKGKVSAEELNQVAERLPGALDLISSSMGMTTSEFRKAAEEGRVLSAEVLEKLPKALHDLYGAAATDAANGPAAQLNRMKTAVFELMAMIGSGPLRVIGTLASVLETLAQAAKTTLGWLSSTLWEKYLFNLSAGFATLATGLSVIAVGFGIYTLATSAAATATWGFITALMANPLTPLFLAAAAAVVGLVAVLKALGDAFFGSSTAGAKHGEALQKSTEASRKAAAERKEVDDSYEKAVGLSLDRQLKKRQAAYDTDLEAVRRKTGRDLADAKDSEIQKNAIMDQYSRDRLLIEDKYVADVAALKKKHLDDEQKGDEAQRTGHIAMLKSLGQAETAASEEMTRNHQQRRQEIQAYYQSRIEAAKAAGVVLVSIEAEQKQAMTDLEKQFLAEAAQRGLERQEDALSRQKATTSLEIAIIESKVARQLLTERQGSEQITKLRGEQLRQEMQLAEQRVALLVQTGRQGTAEYTKALEAQSALQTGYFTEMANAHKTFTDKVSAQYKTHADKIKAIDRSIIDFRAAIQDKIRDLAQKGMTDEEKAADNRKRYDEAVAKSKDALEKKSYDVAEKYNKQAEELASRLADQKDGIAIATAALNQVEEQGVKILEARKVLEQESLDKLKALQDQKLDPKQLTIMMDDPALSAVKSAIAELLKTEKKTIIVETITKGGGSTGMSGGGKLPGGDSLFDSIPVLARPGEWFIRNESASVWGDSFMAAINAPFSSMGKAIRDRLMGFNAGGMVPLAANMQLPRFAGGGQVSSPVNMGTINLQLGGNIFPLQGPVDVLSELNTAVRRLRKAGPQ